MQLSQLLAGSLALPFAALLSGAAYASPPPPTVLNPTVLNPKVLAPPAQATALTPARPSGPASKRALAELPSVGFPEVDGVVSDLKIAGDRLLVAGGFLKIGPGGGSLLQLDKNTLELKHGLPRLEGQINAATTDGNGGAFIAGSFELEELDETSLLHILADGTVEPLIAGFTGNVRGMAWDRVTDVLYMVGGIDSIGGVPRSNAAAVHVGTRTVTAWNPPIVTPTQHAPPLEIVLANGRVWIGGSRFHDDLTTPLRNLIVCDPITGAIDSHDFQIDSSVHSLAADGARVYVGGAFQNVGTAPRSYFAAFDSNTFTLDALDPGFAWSVHALAVAGSELFAGGLFASVNGAPRKGACSIDLNTGTLTNWAPDLQQNGGQNALVYTFIVRPTTVLIGGIFQSVAGDENHNVVLVDRTTAAPRGPGLRLSGGIQLNGAVSALVQTPNSFIIGGQHSFIEAVEQPYLAAVDLASGTVDESWRPAINIGAKTIESNSDTLFVVQGAFNGTSLVAVDLATGAAKPGFVPDFGGANFASIQALAATDTTVYVGAVRYWPSRYFLFALDATTGEPMAQFQTDSLPTNVETFELSRDGSVLYVGGYFTQIGSPPVDRRGIAALDAQTGAVLPWQPLGMDSVTDIYLRGNAAYMTGYVDVPLYGLRNYAVAYDLQTAALLPWAPPIEDVTTVGDARLTSTRGRVIITGHFFGFNGADAHSAVAVDGVLGDSAFGGLPGWQPEVRGTATAVAATGRGVYLGGNFQGVQGVTAKCLMFFPFE